MHGQSSVWRSVIAGPVVVFVVGVCLAAAAGLWLNRLNAEQARTDLEQVAQRVSDAVARRFRQPIYGLHGARGLYAASKLVSRQEFRSYVESRDLAREFPGVRGLGVIERVARDAQASFVARERADGLPQFGIRQLADQSHDDLLVIKFIEPEGQNAGAAGLDVGSEPKRRAGAQLAVDTGQPTVTEAIVLVQDERRSPGVLLYVPMYAKGAPVSNAAERRQAMAGLLYVPIVIAELLRDVHDVVVGKAGFALFEAADLASGVNPLFDSSRIDGDGTNRVSSQLAASRFELVRDVAVPGRALSLRVRSTPAFDAIYSRSTPWWLFAAGTFISALLAALLRQQATGHQRAEAMARRMTADLDRLAKVAQHTSNAVSITDRQTRIQWINEGFTRITGYSLDEARGKTPGELLGSGKAAAPVLQALKDSATNGSSCRVEMLNRARDGHLYWVDTEVQPLHDANGTVSGFMEIGTDITERKSAEARAQTSAQMLRGAIDVIDEAFVIYDPDDRLVLCNDKYRQTYASVAHLLVPGVRFEELIRAGAENGDYSAAIGRVDAWVVERLTAHRAADTMQVQRLENGRTLRIIERRMDDGHTVGFRIDITDLVQATEAAQLGSRVKSQFLANMSHEIRTPMNAVMGMLALLRKTQMTTRQADYAAKAENAARALLMLIDDILDISKIEAGKLTLELRPFRIDQQLHDLSVILSTMVGQKNLEVLFDVDPALPRQLVGDSLRLQQILINLAGNAIKFTPAGEVLVSLLVVHQDAQAVMLEVAVQDTGIGIAPENQAQIFKGFTQAEASITRRFGGTGLGLAISQRLVTLMGGQLELDSALGQGSRFHFRITLTVAHLADGNSQAPATVQGLPWRTLVVDDNPVAREVLARMCTSLGWTVDVVEGGEAALSLLQRQMAASVGYQAMFIDWQMPGLDGWQTCQRIREMQLAGMAPVIVMVTAHGRELLLQRSPKEQALLDGFLVKPVTASMLHDAVLDARAGQGATQAAHHTVPEPARLPGMRILVVEDNTNNQQVVRELLTAEGAVVQIASDGQEGVDAIAHARIPFEVVLMDLQMPVMDGFTATGLIRAQHGLDRLPIVAMTANAMASDRDACLAAGMNDHVGKPFDLGDLVRVLRKNTGWPELIAPAARAPTPQLPPALRDAAAAAGVDLVTAIRRIGDRTDVYQRMLQIFVDDLRSAPARLRSYVAQGGMGPASDLLHGIKGVAATLGADLVCAEAATGEAQLAMASLPLAAAAAVVEHVGAAFDTAIGGLETLLALMSAAENSAAVASAGRLGRPAAVPALQAIAQLLRNGDMAATDAAAALQLRGHPALDLLVQPLCEAVARLDFERALRLCEELIESKAL